MKYDKLALIDFLLREGYDHHSETSRRTQFGHGPVRFYFKLMFLFQFEMYFL